MSAKRFVLVLMLVLSFVPAAFASSYSAVVVYGDSLSDNGNFFAATGYPPAPYYAGRRSDGPLAVEYLAASLGVPLFDYAVIGATTGVGNYADGGTPTSFGAHTFPGMTTVYEATKSSLGPLLSGGLFVVWGGHLNDFLSRLPLETWQDVIDRAVVNEVNIISDLKTLGAYRILAPGMPDLGLTPDFKNAGNAALGTYITNVFNAELVAQLPSGVLYFDTASLMRDVWNNPGAYGLTNATDACFTGNPLTICSNPQNYLFYDLFHPTTAADAIIARGFLSVVPEPSTWMLILLGLALFVLPRQSAEG